MAKIGNVIYGWPLRYNYMGFIREFSAWDFPFVEKSFVQFVRGGGLGKSQVGLRSGLQSGQGPGGFFPGEFSPDIFYMRKFPVTQGWVFRETGLFRFFSRGGGGDFWKSLQSRIFINIFVQNMYLISYTLCYIFGNRQSCFAIIIGNTDVRTKPLRT